MSDSRILVLSDSPRLVAEVEAAMPGCSILHHDRVGDLDAVIRADGLIDVVVAGPVVDHPAPLAALGRLHRQHPRLAIVLALDTPPQASLPDIVRSGAVDLIELPATLSDIASSIGYALELASAPADHTQAARGSKQLAEVLTMASPSGGCGKTFYATNLAFYLQRRTGRRVCLVDLDLQFGEVSAALRLKPRYTLSDAISHSEVDTDLEANLEACLLQDPSGFWVLPAPNEPSVADQIEPQDITRVITTLREQFDYVILDTSAQLSEIVLAAMAQSTHVLCMATLDLPSIRNMRIFLNTLEKLNVSMDTTSVILNKVDDDMGIKIEEVNEALFGKVGCVLPYAREVPRSINQGEPVLRVDPNAEVSARLTAGMWYLVQTPEGDLSLATTPEHGSEGTASRGRRERKSASGWFRRSEMRRSLV